MKFFQIYILVFLPFLAVSVQSISLFDNTQLIKDAKLNMIELVTKHGYPIEEHKITTEDGYILSTYRIPPGKHCGNHTLKKPLILSHGILSSSYDYVAGGLKKSIAYSLANLCYDVWMKNSRGNSVSREHVKLSAKDPDFWDFSWHEMGKYDIPAMVDYILNATNETSLHYIGHSQGTTEFFVFASLYPEYHKKIVSMHALSPVAFLKHIQNPLFKLGAAFVKPLEVLARIFGIYNFNFLFKILHAVSPTLVTVPEFEPFISNLYYIFLGFDEPQFNISSVVTHLGHTPSDLSTKQLYHFAQILKSKKFRQYDYGLYKNMEVYKSLFPPEYNLKAINIPIAIYYSLNDNVLNIKDAKEVIKELPNVIEVYEIPYPKFNHLDFIIATDVQILLYNKIVEVLKRFE